MLVEIGVEILLILNGSFYYCNKLDLWMGYLVVWVVEIGLFVVYLNLVGGQDDQLYDGVIFVLNFGVMGGVDKVL